MLSGPSAKYYRRRPLLLGPNAYLVLVIVFGLYGIILLSTIWISARSINVRLGGTASALIPIHANTKEINLVYRTNDLAGKIQTAAAPLAGDAGQINQTAADINKKALTIQNTVVSINSRVNTIHGTVTTLEGPVGTINSTVHSINGTFTTLLPVTNQISYGASPYGVPNIMIRAVTINGLARSIDGDLTATANYAKEINGHTISICAAPEVSASCP